MTFDLYSIFSLRTSGDEGKHTVYAIILYSSVSLEHKLFEEYFMFKEHIEQLY